MEMPLSHPRRAGWRAAPLWALALIALAATVWLGARLAERQAMARGYARAETTLRLTVNALEADLARYEMVPQLLGDLDLIRQLVADPTNAALLAATNRWLERQNAALQASDIYLMLPDGLTIAASNHGQRLSFVGQNFSYRPYFIDAMRGKPARFYGVGTTSGVRGYFFSAPVRDAGGRIVAVTAVKIGVDRIEAGWQGGASRVLVTDPEGTVFLSSQRAWLYHALQPLTPDRLARTAASRRYAETPLADLPRAAAPRFCACPTAPATPPRPGATISPRPSRCPRRAGPCMCCWTAPSCRPRRG